MHTETIEAGLPGHEAEAALIGPDTTLSGPDTRDIEIAAVLHALSDPLRLRIVGRLSHGEELACGGFDLPITKSTCSHHFRVLREAGVIRQRVDGKSKLNQLRRAELDERFPGLLDSVLRAAEA